MPFRHSIPSTMRAHEIADKALVLRELSVPKPGAEEVLIRVAYVGTNRADVMQIAGTYDPPNGASPLPGLEVSGVIVAKGATVRNFTAGDRVCALLSGGGYAEYVAVPTDQVLAIPKNRSVKEAACLPEAGATSMLALYEQGRMVAGERVLIHGGSSGLGILMSQIAKRDGAEVFATVGREDKAVLLKRLGILPINHRAAPFGEQLKAQTLDEGVDLIIDTLGGPQAETHLRLLRPGGRLVTLAMLEGGTLPNSMKMTRILMNQLTWSGAMLRGRSQAQKAEYMLRLRKEVLPKVTDGTIKPVIDSVFPFLEAEKALQRMQERLHMGKILLEVAAEHG